MKSFWVTLSILTASITGIWLALYLWVLASPSPNTHPLAVYPLWPIACSTRGCVTTTAWNRIHTQTVQFAEANHQDIPTPQSTLTTTVRRHLVEHAFLTSPITSADARRYREEILNIQTDDQLKAVANISISDYDKEVLVPYLQQETLRKQVKAETTEELYQYLSSQRFIFIPLFSYSWNTDSATAEHS